MARKRAVRAKTAGRRFELIAVDGDDTLWHNERVYRMGRERFRTLLTKAGVRGTAEAIDERVNRVELRNLEFYGYGVTSFVLSLIETAIEITDGRITGADLLDLLHLSREMIGAELELFPGAHDAVSQLAATHPLVLITKGDLLHQRAKVEKSGLDRYFAAIEVVSHKTADTYASILSRHGVHPSRFLMIGNSMRSDVVPVIEIGGSAVHIPAGLSWAHEDGTAPADAEGRFFDLDRIAVLPDLVERMEKRGPRRAASRRRTR